MQIAGDVRPLRAAIRDWRGRGQSVGLVATMGNLHAGHFALIRQARARCDRVVVSIFVNPTQFRAGEDFERYPRTPQRDREALTERGCDLLFSPTTQILYPFGTKAAVKIRVPGLSNGLESSFRPGHLDGVASVVLRLLHMVQPDIAVFGRKDYQQLKVIERLVDDLGLSLAIIAAATEREADGLAMSSRNQFLNAAEREVAPELFQTLQLMRRLKKQGHEREAIEQAATARLERLGFQVDYAVVRRADNLELPDANEDAGRVALIAARLGSTRLIDNLEFS